MIDFEFVSPTKIYFGKHKEDMVGSIIASSYKNILIVYGSKSIKKSGLYNKVIDSLNTNNLKYHELSDVRPNPSNDLVVCGVEIAKKEKVDFILAVGGGSVIDTAKAIAVGYYYNGDPFDFNRHIVNPEKALPIGVILTLAASGSELSTSCVISNDKLGIKSGFNSDIIRPTFAILNPELTFTVDKYQTGCGVVDIISHSLERYFMPSGQYEFSDLMALSIIKSTIEAGEQCIKNPSDYDARATMMLNGSYSHNGLTSLGKQAMLTIHAIEHAMSAHKIDIAHGAGLSVLIPAWMDYVYLSDVDKFVKFTQFVFNLSYVDKKESAKIGIQSLKVFFKKIGMPTTLKELGLTSNDILPIANKVTNDGTRLIGRSSIKELNREDIIAILNSVLE